MQKWLDDNDILIYSHNESNSVVAEGFIKTYKG